VRLLAAFLLLLGFLSAETYTYWIEPCADNGTTCRSEDADLAQWALRAWQSASSGELRFEKTGRMEQAQLRFHWAVGRGGLYGEARPILVNGRRGAEIHVRPDLAHLGKEMAAIGQRDPLFRETIVYLTCLHESGHAIGLAHTAAFGDIMYSFQHGGDIVEYFMRYRRKLAARDDIRRNSGISAEDQAALRTLFTSKRP